MNNLDQRFIEANRLIKRQREDRKTYFNKSARIRALNYLLDCTLEKEREIKGRIEMSMRDMRDGRMHESVQFLANVLNEIIIERHRLLAEIKYLDDYNWNCDVLNYHCNGEN